MRAGYACSKGKTMELIIISRVIKFAVFHSGFMGVHGVHFYNAIYALAADFCEIESI